MQNTLAQKADNALSFQQLVDLVKQLPADQKKKLASILSDEEKYITKEEIIEGIKEGLDDVKLYKQGKIELPTLEDFLHNV